MTLDVSVRPIRASSGSHRPEGGYFSFHGIWAPGVRLFRGLHFSAKALIICLCFTLPLGALLHFFIATERAGLAFRHKELIGTALNREVAAVLPSSLQLGLLLQSASTPMAQGEQRKRVNDQLQLVAAAQARHGEELGTVEAYDHLKRAAEAANGTSSVAAQQAVVQALLALMDKANDGSNLTLDPDLDTYYLWNGSLAVAPQLLDAVARARGAATTLTLAVDDSQLKAQTKQLYTALAQISMGWDQLQRALAKVYAEHPELRSRLASEDLSEQIRGFTQATEAREGDAAEIQSQGKRLIETLTVLQGHMIEELAALLDSRVGDLKRQSVLTAALVASCLGLAAYLFYCFYLVTDGGMREVRRHLQAMAGGDLTTSPSPWGKDEAAGLMHALREMQRSLCAIVQDVRTSTDHIVHSSSEIADGSMDLSARTEQTAANLEETAASMEQISGTVQLTATHADQAALIARENADIALQGGEVMARVVSTMDEIGAASGRISEIISTIDGIAFQTNILALNAAVEAARAGESGRGFAVVASEVRALAQRSADAAREIKVLISTSVDKTASGQKVVRDAGTAIANIVTHAQRIGDLINEISTGAREQALGVQQVGQAAQDLDASTQQNAALVEETAAAAASLRDHAQALQQRVSQFQLPQGGADALNHHEPAAGAATEFDFQSAVEAHRAWKVTLRSAIAQHTQLDADTLCRDDACPLGRWVHGPGEKRWGTQPVFVRLVAQHREFHQVAGDVARRINQGSYEDAARMIGSGSRFSKASNAVVSALMQAMRMR